ncbi:hypothetical protein IKG28_00975 [Candidatus Saccharibacteria bacterium]|nr:hypothetical protein [Candidatus Saccharibacteria bacterium]
MPKKSKNKKSLIVGITASVIAIAIIAALIIVFAVTRKPILNDNYFVSDGSKYVLTVDFLANLDEGEEVDELAPIKSHAVYTYSGDTITGLKTYYEYKDAETAKSVYNAVKASEEESPAEKIELDGKYIIMTMPASDYENATATQIKEEIDWYNSYTDDEDDNSEDIEDPAAEEILEETTNVENGDF